MNSLCATSPPARQPSAAASGINPEREQTNGRPRVLVVMALSADGKIATANRSYATFGSRYDRHYLLTLRTTVDAIMCGARTVDLAPITMGPGSPAYRRKRIRNGLAEYPLRVVVSGSGTVNPEAELFRHGFSPILVFTSALASRARRLILQRVADQVRIFGSRQVDLRRALTWLYRRRGVRRLLCEGGGQLNWALLRAGLVDECHLTICPLIIGGREAPTIVDGKGWPSLLQATSLTLKRRRRVGTECYLIYEVEPAFASAGHSPPPSRPASRRANSHNTSESRLR